MYKKENPIPGKIIAVTNRTLCDRSFLEQVKRVCEKKPAALILREKDLPQTEYESLAIQVLKICAEYGGDLYSAQLSGSRRAVREQVHSSAASIIKSLYGKNGK